LSMATLAKIAQRSSARLASCTAPFGDFVPVSAACSLYVPIVGSKSSAGAVVVGAGCRGGGGAPDSCHIRLRDLFAPLGIAREEGAGGRTSDRCGLSAPALIRRPSMIRTIPLDKLVPSPRNVRRHADA